MKTIKYLEMLNARRQLLTGIQRVWADFNIELEILQERPSYDIVEMAVADCREIIADLEKRPQTQDIADALEIKRNQRNELLAMLQQTVEGGAV
jgi:hypothetical protein